MALTGDVKETILLTPGAIPHFRRALFKEALESFLAGDVNTGKTILRDFINATVGFRKAGTRD